MSADDVEESGGLPLQPLRDYILASEERDSGRSRAGVILPSNTLGQPAFARVEAVGPDVGADFAAGDVILFKEDSAFNVFLDGREYLLLKSGAVMAKRIVA